MESLSCMNAKYHVYSYLKPFFLHAGALQNCFSLAKVEKGKALKPPPSSHWNLTPVTSHGGFGFSVSQAVPEHPLSVWTSSASEGSLPEPHCSIATAGNVLLESQKTASVLMKRCEWNNWARTGDYFLSHLFIKTPLRDSLSWILLDFLF